MSDAITKEHPLTNFIQQLDSNYATDPGLRITVEPFKSYLNIRGNPKDRHFGEAVTRTLSLELPLANRVVRGEHSLYWLGPNEFLLVSRDSGQQLVNELNYALQGQHAAVTDLSGGQLMVTIAGTASRRFLSKASTLDLHESVFTTRHCAQSTFAKATALYALRDESPEFELIVRRSFADYVAKWMAYSGQEFGVLFDELSETP